MPQPRTPKTPEEASRDNARKFNAKEAARHPLWTGAGLEDDLRRSGIIRTRTEDHQLRLQASTNARLQALQARHAHEAELYRRALKREAPAAYREALLSLRRMQLRFSSMRDPTKVCDHWHTHLRKALPTSRWRTIEVDIHPQAAEEHRVFDWIHARLARRQQQGGVQPLLPFHVPI